MLQVGQSWKARRQARHADLSPPAHVRPEALLPDDVEDAPRGPYLVDSPFDEPQPEPAPSRLSRWRPNSLRLLAGALVLGLALGAAEETLRHNGYAPDFERLARAAGFGVDQVTLKGHNFSFDRDIFDALDLANVRTFAALDTAAVKARIERLPWIDKAELTRVFPGRLDIRVTERKPYALWRRADRNYLIDRTGRVLAAVSGETLPDLPRFAGEGAALEATPFMETLARYPNLARAFAEAERVSERRWRLKLSNGAVLELPADGEVGALEAIARDGALMRRVMAGHATVDFRGPGRLAVRPEAEAAAAAAPQARAGS
mgnify:CR=1 FL=1